jgi:hypothetical protein
MVMKNNIQILVETSVVFINVKDMKVGGNVSDIHYSGGDAKGTEFGGKIGGTQHIISNINIVARLVIEDVNAIQNRLASVVVVVIPRPTYEQRVFFGGLLFFMEGIYYTLKLYNFLIFLFFWGG